MTLKKLLKSLFLLCFIALLGCLTYLYSTTLAVQNIKIRQENLYSSNLSEEFDGLKIVFFSDTHLNGFVDEERFQDVIHLINAQQPDLVLFGGDLFDHPANNIPSTELIEKTTALLSSIEADLGKFAVLGNHDLEAVSSKEMISQLLNQADFEIITNTALRIRNHGSNSIVLAGLDSELLGNPNPEAVFEAIQADDFTITLCHTPDTILNCPTSLIDLFLSGHSHGGQVYIPVVGALYKVPYAEQYYRGKHQIDNALLDISNGTGTTRMDIRFLANPEIVVYTLHSKV